MRMTRMNSNRPGHQGARGFTLIEMMIVVAIIAVVAAIAYPNYNDYMMKSRRSDAKALLSGMAARQEQYFLDNKTYTATLGNLGYSTNGDGSVTSEKRYYTVAAAATAVTYTLTATPQGVQASDKCTTLTLDEEGTKDATVPASTPAGEVNALKAKCW